jgi:hypothetical protein
MINFRLISFLIIGFFSRKMNKYRICYLSFINTELFNFPKKSHQNRFISISILNQIISSLFTSRIKLSFDKSSDQVLLITNPIDDKYFINYLGYKKDLNVEFVISRSQLLSNSNFALKVYHIIFSIIYIIVVFPITFFSKKRVYISSFLITLIQFNNLYSILKKNRIKHVYFFESFSNDANVLVLLLKQLNINSTRIPSSNPLKNFYKYVFADKFIFTAPFHREEFDSLKKNWIFQQIEDGPMLDYNEAIKVIKSKKNNYDYDIGFISSGSWLKNKHDINLLEKNSFNAEFQLLSIIDELCVKNNLKLVVLIHPVERKSQYQSEVKDYYSNIKCDYQFPSENCSSFEYFNKVNLCVTVSSSATFIRLFANLKSLFFPIDIENKYLETKINNISINDALLIESRILNDLRLSESEFFNNYNISDYSYSFNHLYLDDLL